MGDRIFYSRFLGMEYYVFFSSCDRIMRIEEFDHLLVMKEKLKIAMASDLPVGWWEAYHKI